MSSQAPEGSHDKNQPIKRRSLVACTRCRLARGKCVHNGSPPCNSCISASKQEECLFPPRGTSLQDRAPRGIRKRRKKEDDTATSSISPESSSTTTASLSVPSSSHTFANEAFSAEPRAVHSGGGSRMLHIDGDSLLPPHRCLMDGCEAFFDGYSQISFLPRPLFLHQLSTEPQSINTFLLLSILAISARFTPSLIERYGGKLAASDVFAARAHAMILDEMMMPTIERAQAFYLLGICDWGRGFGFRSRMLQGLALQVAEMIDLSSHDPAASDLQIEIRRRTWWFVTVNNNRHSIGAALPHVHDPMQSRVPLPSNEDDFAFGCLTSPPSYFQINPGGGESPNTSMSLCAMMVTILAIWGRTARALCGLEHLPDKKPRPTQPWKTGSVFEHTNRELQQWLSRLNQKQLWSTSNLLAYRSTNHDLGFYNSFVNLHITSLAVRRQYLPIMIKALHPLASDEAALIEGEAPPGGLDYWRKMASAMVSHAFDVLELQESVSKVRITSEGGTPFMAFAVYLAGSMLNYVRLCGWLCPPMVQRAGGGLIFALEMLRDFVEVWPVSGRWFATLSAQAGMSPPDSTFGDRATELASHDINLDSRIGIYRQFAHDQGKTDGPPELYRHSELVPPNSQLVAASTLAQLSSARLEEETHQGENLASQVLPSRPSHQTSFSSSSPVSLSPSHLDFAALLPQQHPPSHVADTSAQPDQPEGDVPSQHHDIQIGADSFFDLDRFESDLSTFLLGQDTQGIDFGPSGFLDGSWGQ
ncbi:hypothetical protein T439DRAFT_323535 [Meredithblackwellia eburnea MCA 4105]